MAAIRLTGRSSLAQSTQRGNSEGCKAIYFFEKACGVSGLILGVNPFNQPGVEAYKKNMFALLGKPGYEAETIAIRKRLAEE